MAITTRTLITGRTYALLPGAVYRGARGCAAWIVGTEAGWILCTFIGLGIAAALT